MVFIVFIFLDLLNVKVYVSVSLSVGVVNCFGLEIVYRNHPPVPEYFIVAAEKEFSPTFVLALFVSPHRDTQHESGSIVMDLKRLKNVVNEFERYLSKWLLVL